MLLPVGKYDVWRDDLRSFNPRRLTLVMEVIIIEHVKGPTVPEAWIDIHAVHDEHKQTHTQTDLYDAVHTRMGQTLG